MTDIFVHIVTYNSASTIRMCLDSLQHQDFKDYQVRVFDNASSDETCQIVNEANIPLIESPENLGYARAHNRLIDHTESTYVLTLNPDAYLLPGFLASMKAVLDKNDRIGSAAGQLLRVERLGELPQVIDSAGLAMRRNRGQQLLGASTAIHEYTTPASPIFGPDGAAAFYRRAMLDDIRVMDEVFDSDFFLHKEDIDVCWRAQLRGWQSVYNPDAIAHHIRSFRIDQRANVPNSIRCMAVRNRYLLMIKNEIPAHFIRDFPRIFAHDIGIFFYICLRERTSFAAYSSLWSLRKQMLKKRRIVQSHRRVQWQEMAHWFRS